MKSLFLSTFFLLLTLPLFAQNEAALKEVRAHYYSLGDKIKACADASADEACELYQDETVVNAKDMPWPAVGTYQKRVRFYYNMLPDLGVQEYNDPLYGLQKIEVESVSSVREEYLEYVLKEGAIIFRFSRENWEGEDFESRMYFDKGVLFKYNINGEDKPPQFDMESLHVEFTEYANIFKALHGF